jgi:hypothetical protein
VSENLTETVNVSPSAPGVVVRPVTTGGAFTVMEKPKKWGKALSGTVLDQ